MRVKVNSTGKSALKVASFIMIVFTIISILFFKAGIDKKEGALVIVAFGVLSVVIYFLYLTFKRPLKLNAILVKKNKIKIENKEITNLTFQIDDEYAPEYVGGTYYCTLEGEDCLTENSHYIVEVKEFTHNIEAIHTNNEPSFVKQNSQPKTNYYIDNIILNNLGRTSILYFIIWIVLTCIFFACNLKTTNFILFETVGVLVLIILQGAVIGLIFKYSDRDKKVMRKLNLKIDKLKPVHNYKKYKINKYIKNGTLDSYLVINEDNTLLYKIQRLTPINNNYVISDSSSDIIGDIMYRSNKYLIRMKNRKMHFAKILTKGTILLDETYQFTKIYYGKGYKISDKKGNVICKIKPYEKNEKYAFNGSCSVEIADNVNNNDQIMLLSIIGTILKEK